MGSVTPTFFRYRIVYIAGEESCPVGLVFRWLGRLQLLCAMPFFPSATCKTFPFADNCWDWESSLCRRQRLEAVKPFEGWQLFWKKLLMARSSCSSLQLLFCHCTVVFTPPVCSLGRNAGSSVPDTLQGVGGLTIVAFKFVSCYCKTETNSLPSQLAVVTL